MPRSKGKKYIYYKINKRREDGKKAAPTPCKTNILQRARRAAHGVSPTLDARGVPRLPPSLPMVCLVPSRHLCAAVCVVDCGQEVPQLRFPGRDDRPVAVPGERVRPGRVHQHLRGRQGDRVGLRRRRQTPQPVLSSATLPHRCQQKDSASPKGTQASQTPPSACCCWPPGAPACRLLWRSEPTPSDHTGICKQKCRNTQALSLWARSGFQCVPGVRAEQPT